MTMIRRRAVLKALAGAGLASAAWHPSALRSLLTVPPAAAQELPKLPQGRGISVAVIGAGIAGFTAAYELRRAGFEVTIYEGQKRYGGRSLTVRPSDPDYKSWYLSTNRFVKADSYCDFIPAEVRGAMVGEQKADFVPEPLGDGYFDLAFNAGPGRIPTLHTGILHYCRTFGVEMIPYIFSSETNLIQADTFNGGKPVQLRRLRNDLRGYLSEMLHDRADQAVRDEIGLDASSVVNLRQILKQFGDLASDGDFRNTSRAGYIAAPGAGTNSGRLQNMLPLEEILDSPDLWPDLFASMNIRWQAPLLQPAGGMDMIWQAFLAQETDGVELRQHVRLQHEITGMRYADAERGKVIVSYTGPENEAGEAVHDYIIMTGAPFCLARMQLEDLLDDAIKEFLESALYQSGGKFAFQAKSRFWESSELQIFGGISWTDRLNSQIWYPSDGYNGPTGILTAAYIWDTFPSDFSGMYYPPQSGYLTPVDPADIPSSRKKAHRWSGMDQSERTAQTLAGCNALHPDFRDRIYPETGLSISWDNQPFQKGIECVDMAEARPDAYARLLRPVDRNERIYLAGDYMSYLPGWQEGAVRSAWWTLGLIGERVRARRQ